MKKQSKLLSIFMVVMIFIGSVSGGAFALTSPEDWENYYNNDADASIGLIMQPGSNGTERNFSWYAPDNSEQCSVTFSKNSDLSDAQVSYGKYIKTYQKDYSAKVTITGLEENTTYYYKCTSPSIDTKTYSFTTESNTFSAIYVTDIHVSGGTDSDNSLLVSSSYMFANTIEKALISSPSANLILSAGDQASNGLRNEYIALTASPFIKSLTFSTAIGNHDTKSVDYKYFNNVPNEYYGLVNSYQGGDYWFAKGNVLFLIIDSNNGSGIDHSNFLSKAVQENPQAKWKVAVFHHDLYGKTIPNRENENKLLRTIYSPLMDEYGIDLVLMGHSHHYSISDVIYNGKVISNVTENCTVNDAEGTVYMVSGSVCSPRNTDDVNFSDFIGVTCKNQDSSIYNIIDFSDDAIVVKSYTVDNGIFNTLTINKGDNKNGGISFIRKLQSKIVNFLGTIFAVFNNMTDCTTLKKKGFDISYVESLLNNKDIDNSSNWILNTYC